MCDVCGAMQNTHEDGLISSDVYVTTSAKPVVSVSQAVVYLTTQWPGQLGTTRTWLNTNSLTYAISVTPEIGSTEASGYVAMTAAMRAAARESFELWDDVIAINLDEAAVPTANINFAYSSTTAGGGNYTRTYTSYTGTIDQRITAAYVWLNAATTTHDTDADMVYGGYGRLTYVHEIGHALGLSHPGLYDASLGAVTYMNAAAFAQDTRQFTVMSYFNAGSDAAGVDHIGSNNARAYAAAPLLYDIAAAQAKYGADMTTRVGDTTYGFNSNAGRGVFDFTQNKNPVVAIWDAGGNDTLDVSGFSTNQRVSLVAGVFSDVGSMTRNVVIAFGAVLENAILGSGNDEVEGNGVANALTGGAGDDTLYGGDGADTLYGGAGADVLQGDAGADLFVVSRGGGADRVVDFTVGVDHVAFEAVPSVVDFASLTLTDQPDGVLVTWGEAGASLLLAGVTKVQLTGADFGLAPAAPAGLRLVGGSSGDLLVGLAGDDTLSGWDGNDTLVGGAGADRLDGGSGYDVVGYGGATSGVTVDVAGGQGAGDAAGDTFVSIERYGLTGFSDVFLGSAAKESVFAGAGADRIVGGGGADQLYGQSGADTFVFGAQPGCATIGDFAAGIDKIEIAVAGVTAFSQLTLTETSWGVLVEWGVAGAAAALNGLTKARLSASDFVFSGGPARDASPSSQVSSFVDHDGLHPFTPTGALDVADLHGALRSMDTVWVEAWRPLGTAARDAAWADGIF